MKSIFTISLLCLLAMNARSELPLETYGQLTLDTLPQHTLLINTFSHNAVLFNADTQQMLGTISTGIGANAFEVDRKKASSTQQRLTLAGTPEDSVPMSSVLTT